jgi:hypothetical protein
MPDQDISLVITTDATGHVTAMKQASDATKKYEADTAASLSSVKTGYKDFMVALSATVYAVEKAFETIDKAAKYLELGAKVLQTEEAFKHASDFMGVSADKMLADMKRLTAGTVDDSDLMQKAMKMMTAGMDPAKVVQVAEISRAVARRMGIDVSEAFGSISDAIETQRTKALRMYGLITPEQARWIQQIQATGKELDLMKVIMTNVEAQTVRMGDVALNAAERFQRWTASMKENREEGGKWLNAALDFVTPTDPKGKPTIPGLNAPRSASGVQYPVDRTYDYVPWSGGGKGAVDKQKQMNAELEREAGEKKALELAKQFDAYEKSIEALNPWLTEYERKILGVDERAKALTTTMKANNALTDDYKARIEADRQKGDQYIRQAEAIKTIETASRTAGDYAKTQHSEEMIWFGYEKEMFSAEMDHALKMNDMALKTDQTFGPTALAVKYDWQKRSLEMQLLDLDAKVRGIAYEDQDVSIGLQREAIFKRIKDLRYYEAFELDQLSLKHEQMLLDLISQRYDKEIQGRNQIQGDVVSAGELGPGLANMQQGAMGMLNVAQKKDPYAVQLQQLQQYWQKVLNAYSQGNASIEQLEAARVAWSTAASQQEAMQKISYASYAAQSLVGIGQMLYAASGSQSAALFYITKGFAVAQATINAFLASTQALAHPPGPPETIPMAELVLDMGLASAAAIAATAFMGSPGGAGAVAASAGMPTYTPPAVSGSATSTPAATTNPPAAARPITINLTVYGTVGGSLDKFARDLVSPLQKAWSDGVH